MTYWAAAAGVMSFASAFLLAKGFAPSMVGVLLASGNLLSCALQPLLADRADRIGGSILTPIAGWAATLITIYSGYDYLSRNWALVAEGATKPKLK